MRLGFYVNKWPAEFAQTGIATYVDVLTRALRALGHDCFIFTREWLGDREPEESVHIVQAGRPSALDRVKRKFGLATLSSQNIDGFATQLADAMGKISPSLDFMEVEESFGLPMRLARKTDVPIIARLHGPICLVGLDADIHSVKERIVHEKIDINAVCGISSPSAGVLNDYLAFYGLEETNRHQVIPNPIDLPHTSLSWNSDSVKSNTIVYVGRIDLRKGADVALRAFQRVRKACPSAILTIAGDDSGIADGDGQPLQYQDYVDKYLNNDERAGITFVGRQPLHEVSLLRSSAAVVVSASRFECFPYAVIEALAQGCPTVASRTYGAAEFFDVNNEILIADVADANGLAESIISLLSNPDKAREMGTRGKQAVADRLNPLHIAQKTIEFYQNRQSQHYRAE